MRTVALSFIALCVFFVDCYIYCYPREIPMVNPLNLGAHCDGEHDDTEAFNKAYDYAASTGIAIYVPNNCWISYIPRNSTIAMRGIGEPKPNLYYLRPSALYLHMKYKHHNWGSKIDENIPDININLEDYYPDKS